MSYGRQKPIQVLHVDDEPDFADLTKTFLEQEDDRFTVETATSADDGLAALDDRPPDCIVSDYNMPGMDGLEFLQAVREGHPDLPFILFTGKGSEEVASDAISAGASDYLRKRSGNEQYSLLANRVLNAVTQFRSEKRLRETREEYAAVFENAKNGLLLVNVEDGGFRYEQCNPRGVELIGRDRTEIVGQTPYEALGPENGQKVVGAYRTCLHQRDSVEYTVTLDLPVGRVVRECEVSPVESNGEVTQLVVAFRDVTDRRKRQRDLEKVETLFQHAQDSLFLVDVTDEFVVERVNPAYEDATGVSASEIRGQTPEQLLGEEQGTAVEARYRECVERREPLQYTEQLQFGREPSYWETSIAPVVVGDTVEYIAGSTRDITDRRKREEQLQEVSGQYQTLVEHFPDGAVFLYDTDLRVVRAGGSELSKVGLSPEELHGTSPHDRYPPDIAEELVHGIEDALAGESHTFEQEYRGGHYRIQTVPVRTDDGEVTHSMAVSQNITDQVEARQELERQNDLFAKAQDIADIGAWAHDIESGTLTWTDQVYEMHAVSKAFDPSVDDVPQLYHPDDRPKLREAVNQAVTAGEPYDLEVRMTATDDGTRWFRTVADPQTENGDVVRVRGTVHDITDRVEREQELRQYEHFFENSPDQIALLDEDFTVQYQSPPSSLHELEAIEVEGDDPLEYVHPDDRQTLSNHFEQVLMNPDESFSEEFRAKDVSGEWRWVETRAINLLDEDPADGILVMIRDVTRQKRQRLALQRQNERLDEFASIVSHDLRSPLSVAEGHLELAQDTCENDHLARAGDAIERSQALIDELLTLAREGEAVTETEPVEIAAVATSGWQTVDSGQATLDIDASQVIEADHSRLQELFENLYRNAVEHGGETVTVSVGAMDDGFYVADTGPGIPDSDREKVFEAGYSTDEDGIGLGLRIVEQIADAHGWEITATESHQGGARFEVTGVDFADR